MLPKNICYYGKDEELPAQIPLRAGPFDLIYENGDLRYIRLGQVEVIRRIYVAIRDRNWGTIAPVFSDVAMQIAPDSFRITYHVQNLLDEINFAWTGVILGEADGTIHFSMEGAARSTFWRNRIGFCVLYPASAAGQNALVAHTDGSSEQAQFPVDINSNQPVEPFANLRSITQEVSPAARVVVSFEGDTFEMEDQRNWTDASYKIFSTPLSLPYPVEIRQGTKVRQQISMYFQQMANARLDVTADLREKEEPVLLEAELDRPLAPVAGIGLGMAASMQPMTEKEHERIGALRLHHLRVDLQLSAAGWEERLLLADRESRLLGVPLIVALIGPETAGQVVLSRVRQVLDKLHPAVFAWLCYPASEIFQGGSATIQAVQSVRDALRGIDPAIPICAGTNTDLIFMKRTPPPVDLIDQVTFSICPQVHAFDNASLMETLEAQAVAVESARRLAPGLPVMVSPVTLKMRINPYASAPGLVLKPGILPPNVDERQMSLFGAAWTLGSIRALSEAGASTVTYYETTGWQGVMETTAGSPLPERFHSYPGGVFPLYHVLADVGDFASGRVRPLRCSQPLKAAGVYLEKGGRQRLVIANLTAAAQKVEVRNVPGRFTCRVLDETTIVEAMTQPENFRAKAGPPLTHDAGCQWLTLLPYATLCLDRQADTINESLA